MSRRKDPHLLALAVRSDWKFSAALAVFALVFGFVFIPWFIAPLAFAGAIAGVLQKVSAGAAILFGLIALARFFFPGSRNSRTQAARDLTTSSTSRRPRPAVNVSKSEPTLRTPAPAPSVEPLRPSQWSLALLRAVEWNRFEKIVAAYFSSRGIRCETTGYGPDGGIDAKIYAGDPDKPVAIVQCKSWIGNVGIKPIRELAGVMAHEKVSKGHFFTTAGFSDEAVKFASQNRINLVSGEALLAAIRLMSDAKQAELLQIATEGDYLTPTCASCGIKLLVRT